MTRRRPTDPDVRDRCLVDLFAPRPQPRPLWAEREPIALDPLVQPAPLADKALRGNQ